MYRRFYKGLSKVEKVIEGFEEYLYLLLLAAMVIVILIQVVGRYFIGLATPWAEEIARYSFIWISWIIGAYSLRYGRHIVMNLIDGPISRSKNPKLLFFIINKISYSCVMAFIGVALSYFYDYFTRVRTGGRVSSAMSAPMWIVMLGVLLGMVLMIVQSIYVLLEPYEAGTNEGEEAKQA